MPPLAHAMSLINGKQRDLRIGQHIGKARRRHPLGRHIEEVQFPASQLPAHLARFLLGQRGIERRCGHAGLFQRLHLVAHQGDQRRNNDTDAGPANRRDLVAHRLAGTSGKQHHSVAALGHMLDHIGLLPAKRLVPENIAQHRKRAGPLMALGREQVDRLNGFHTSLESRGRGQGNRRGR